LVLTTQISTGSGIDIVFHIRLAAAKSAIDDDSAVGTITLGSFKETFESPLSFWTRNDYEAHWVHALERLVDGSESTALVTEMYDPLSANFITWWPAYRFGSKVRFHNQLLLLAHLSIPLLPNDLFRHVPPYQDTNDDGDRLSEWTVPIDDLCQFLANSAR
jgi:CdiI N-terminal domain